LRLQVNQETAVPGKKKRDMTEVVPLRQKAPARVYTPEEREK